ncbi:MAG: hypothetical protein ACI81A_001848 [Paraglaciecola sp.]|jgi:hypothetical protein
MSQGQVVLIFNCTKAAAEFFSCTRKGKIISPIEPAPKTTIAESMAETNGRLYWQWLVHVIKVKGKNVLVAMDCQTRFCITLSSLTKGDDVSFLNNFEHHLSVHIHELMTSVDANSQAIDTSLEHYRQQHDNCTFYLRGERSVQKHINDVAWHFRRWTDDRGQVPTGVDLIGIDAFANQLLRQNKADKTSFYPQREFLYAWLLHYGKHNTAQADACIAILKAKERADFNARCELSHLGSDHSPEPTEPSGLTGNFPEHDNVISLDAYRNK